MWEIINTLSSCGSSGCKRGLIKMTYSAKLRRGWEAKHTWSICSAQLPSGPFLDMNSFDSHTNLTREGFSIAWMGQLWFWEVVLYHRWQREALVYSAAHCPLDVLTECPNPGTIEGHGSRERRSWETVPDPSSALISYKTTFKLPQCFLM